MKYAMIMFSFQLSIVNLSANMINVLTLIEKRKMYTSCSSCSSISQSNPVVKCEEFHSFYTSK